MFEGFRDLLIDIQNQGFPVVAGRRHRRQVARSVDECFGSYYASEPLGLVVVGASEMQSAFRSVTDHGAAIIGGVEGDHTVTSARDLGQIVWPVVKERMSGVLDRALRDLDDCARRGQVAAGLEAVVRVAGRDTHATLLVEEDYRRRGSISRTREPPVITPDVDVGDTADDVVDAVIDRVLDSAGKVVFTPPGALNDREHIVLLRGTKGS